MLSSHNLGSITKQEAKHREKNPAQRWTHFLSRIGVHAMYNVHIFVKFLLVGVSYLAYFPIQSSFYSILQTMCSDS